MKKIMLWLLLILVVNILSWATPIVNNSGASSEDSLSFTILNLLPSGNPAEVLDSAYFTVFKSGTNDVVFRDSSTGVTMTGVDSFLIGGDIVYYFHRATADIDGTGADGAYSYNFTSIYNDSSMRTPTVGSFQIINNELSDALDSAAYAQLNYDSILILLDSINALESWVANEASLYDPVTDSVIIDGTAFASLNGILVSNTWGGSGLAAVGLIVNDSVLKYFTLRGTNRSVTSYNADVDTVFIFSSAADTIGAAIYFHPGGTAGDPPDSTRYKVM